MIKNSLAGLLFAFWVFRNILQIPVDIVGDLIRYFYWWIFLIILSLPCLFIEGFNLAFFLKLCFESIQFLLLFINLFFSLLYLLLPVFPFHLNLCHSCLLVLDTHFCIQLDQSQDKGQVKVVIDNGNRLETLKVFSDSLALCVW